jgi:hypothetical protein
MKHLVALLLLASQALASQGGYLFVTFKNGNNALAEQVYFAISQDGQNWKALNGSNPVLVSNIGEKGARDPYLLRSHDGTKFYVIATDLSIYYYPNWTRAVQAGSHSILVWESSDLVNWSAPRLVAIAPSDAGCTWAPEAIYDDTAGDYLVHWASKSASDGYAKQRIWACRTTDFTNFSAPFIYIERTNDVIDADIVKDGGTFYRFTKDETYKAITMEASSQLQGTWTNVPGFTLAAMQGYEGPECYQLSSGNWCLIADHYTVSAGYEPFVTTNLATGNFTAAAGFNFPFAFRHGAVLPITAEEYTRLDTALRFTTQAHLLFNEASGTTTADAAGKGWNGTLVNGPQFVAGQGGRAVSLDGTNDYVSLPAGVVSSYSDFTISTWVKINSLATWARIFDFGTGTGAYMFLTPKAGVTDAVRFAISTTSYNDEKIINGTAALPVGVWTHVAITLQTNLGILYVNGVEVGRNPALSLTPSALGATTQNWIGRSQFSGDPYFNGLVDDLRIYPTAYSSNAIQALYTGLAGALPAAWTNLDLGTPSLAGSSGSAGAADSEMVLTAAGTGIQGTADQGHFTYRPWTGDGALTVRLNFISTNSSAATRAGIMFRDGLSANARCLFLGLDQSGNLNWQHRDSAGGSTATTTSNTSPAASWLRLARSGNVFTASFSADGVVWNQAGSPVPLALPVMLNLGLAMSSGSNTALEVARFSNVVITDPALASPGGLAAVAQSAAIDLSWQSVSGATGYSLKRATSSGGPFAPLATSLTATNYSDTLTTNGATYYYVVATLNADRESPDSAAVSAALLSDYQQWKVSHGLAVDIADTATPDGDGMPVLLKFALGITPGNPAVSPVAPVTVAPFGIKFPRLSPAPVRYVVQASSDFNTWTNIATLAYAEDAWTGTATVVEDTATEPRVATVFDDSPANSLAQRFFRLQVQRSVP